MPGVLPSPDEVPFLVPQRGGPVWRAAGDMRTMSTAGYALVLQVAHPTVGAGVAQHSDFAADPWGRLLRTLDYVNGTIYGGPDLAADIGRRVRGMHKAIKGVTPDGHRYHALEPRAYAWVHATLASSIVDGHARFGSPMRHEQKEAFWAEWRRLGRLIGVRDRDLPESWQGFREYFEQTVEDELTDNPTVHLVLDTLGQPAAPPLQGAPAALWSVMRGPLARQIRMTTIGMLPPVLRERLGLQWSLAEEVALRAVGLASRASGPLVGMLGNSGPRYVRWRRAEMDPGGQRPVARAAATGDPRAREAL